MYDDNFSRDWNLGYQAAIGVGKKEGRQEVIEEVLKLCKRAKDNWSDYGKLCHEANAVISVMDDFEKILTDLRRKFSGMIKEMMIFTILNEYKYEDYFGIMN